MKVTVKTGSTGISYESDTLAEFSPLSKYGAESFRNLLELLDNMTKNAIKAERSQLLENQTPTKND